MAVEMVDVYDKKTGVKTRLPKSAVKFFPDFTTTPKGRDTAEKKKEA